MTKKILIIFASTVWLATGCGSSTAHENAQKATDTVVDSTKGTVSKSTKTMEEKMKEAGNALKTVADQAKSKAKELAGDAAEGIKKTSDTVHKKVVETMEKVQEKVHEDKAGDDNSTEKSLMDKVTDAANKAKEVATSTMKTVKEKTSEAVDATKAAATSAVETVKEKAGEAVDKAKEHLKGSAPETKTDTNKTLFDRITDTVHNAEETTQSLGTTAKVVNAVRKTLGD